MKRSSFFKTVPIFSLLLFMVSCRKEAGQSSPAPDPGPTSAVLKRVGRDADNYLALEYANGLVSKVNLVENGQRKTVTITYNANKKPETATLNDDRLRFVYAGERLDKVEYTDPSTPNALKAYVQYSFNRDRLAEATRYRWRNCAFVPDRMNYYLYDQSGNVKTITDYVPTGYGDDFFYNGHVSYDYDTQANPVLLPAEIVYVLQLNPTPHNVTARRAYDDHEQLQERRFYSYEYNENNLPSKAVEAIHHVSNFPVIKNITYAY